jgi:putative phage-type endonuclease
VIEQGSAEWVKARVGLLTASNMASAMSFTKDGKESAARRKLKRDLLAERLVGAAVDHFVSDAMQWGLDTEAKAKEAFEAASGEILLPAGFVEHKTIPFFGATPDALIDGDGIFEAKCPTTATHLDYLLAGKVPAEYKPQMVAQMLCTRRRYGVFVSFDPRLPPKQQLFVRRYDPTPEEFAEVESAAVKFLAEVETMWEALHS